MATHSSVLAWRISGTAEPGGLPSMGSHKVGHDWSNLAAAAAAAACVDMNLSKLQELVMGREVWHAAIHGVAKRRTWLSNWTELNWCGEMRWEWWYLLVCTSKTPRIWDELDPGFEQLLLWVSSISCSLQFLWWFYSKVSHPRFYWHLEVNNPLLWGIVLCRMLSSIPDLYPPDTSGT